jgi:hypothetical protein
MFNIQKFYIVLALRRVFCTDLKIDSDLCFLRHYLIGFYNRGGKCLLRGRDSPYIEQITLRLWKVKHNLCDIPLLCVQ